MKHSKSNKKVQKELASNAKHNDLLRFDYVGLDHITSKAICTSCNANWKAVASGSCCDSPKYYRIGKIMRTPKGNSRYKWKKFYAYLAKRNKKLLTEFPHLIKKYNLEK